MQPDTQTQTVLVLARQKGMLRSNDLKEAGLARVILTRLTATGQLEKVGRGLYRLPQTQASEFESLITVAIKVPQAVFCLLTALQFHGLTTHQCKVPLRRVRCGPCPNPGLRTGDSVARHWRRPGNACQSGCRRLCRSGTRVASGSGLPVDSSDRPHSWKLIQRITASVRRGR